MSISLKTSLTSLLLASAIVIAPDAMAADNLAPLSMTEVEFGTGWYLRGELGGTLNEVVANFGTEDNKAEVPFGEAVTFGLGAGHDFNNGFRGEFSLNHYNGLKFSNSVPYHCGTYERQVTRMIPTDHDGDPLTPPINQPQEVLEVVVDNGDCRYKAQANVSASTIMANAYFDAPTIGRFTPYIGAGAGLAVVSWNEFKDFDLCSGRDSLECRGEGSGIHTFREGEAVTNTGFAPAVSLSVGTAIDLTRNTKLDFGYRYTNIGGTTITRSADNQLHINDTETENMHLHELRVGLRYEIW